jgi:copper chaperone CopZ
LPHEDDGVQRTGPEAASPIDRGRCYSTFRTSNTMQTELLKVTGMTCGGCTSKVANALKRVPGVNGVNVSLSAGEAAVQYDEQLTSPDQLKSAVEGAGYDVGLNAAKSHKSKGGCCGEG